MKAVTRRVALTAACAVALPRAPPRPPTPIGPQDIGPGGFNAWTSTPVLACGQRQRRWATCSRRHAEDGR